MQLPPNFDFGDPGGLESLRGPAFEGLGNYQGQRGPTFEGLRGSFEGHVNDLRGAMFYVCKVAYMRFYIYICLLFVVRYSCPYFEQIFNDKLTLAANI